MKWNIKTFVVYVSSFSLKSIHLDREAQIALLLTKNVNILDKYSDFANILLIQQTSVLSERTKLNQYAIELQDDKKLPYRPIYSLKLVELKTLKTYILSGKWLHSVFHVTY